METLENQRWQEEEQNADLFQVWEFPPPKKKKHCLDEMQAHAVYWAGRGQNTWNTPNDLDAQTPAVLLFPPVSGSHQATPSNFEKSGEFEMNFFQLRRPGQAKETLPVSTATHILRRTGWRSSSAGEEHSCYGNSIDPHRTSKKHFGRTTATRISPK